MNGVELRVKRQHAVYERVGGAMDNVRHGESCLRRAERTDHILRPVLAL